jgi:lysyl oxidase-like protein 2/3/4
MSPPRNTTKEGYLWTPTSITDGLPTHATVQGTQVTSLKSSYDVIVIGAGFTGLTAARDLSLTYNLRVLLIDARDRIGGRTWTANVLGEDLEMGGTWVHWNQPHVYRELHRYNLHRGLKTSAGTTNTEKQWFLPKDAGVSGITNVGEEESDKLEEIAQQVFTIDGLDSRTLMPFPHDSLREPALWKKYDHLTVRDRLDQITGFTKREKGLFESNTNTFGSAPASEIGFVEALRWFALGGHSMAGVFELAGVFKLGKGGMTAFARNMFAEFRGDSIFGGVVKEVKQVAGGVEIRMADGSMKRAKVVVSTIPLWVLHCLISLGLGMDLTDVGTA